MTSSNENSTNEKGSERVLLSVPRWVRVASTFFGLALIGTAALGVLLFIFRTNHHPKPTDFDVALLCAAGIGLVVVVNVPWTKLQLGSLTVERALKVELESYAEELEELRKKLSEKSTRADEADALDEAGAPDMAKNDRKDPLHLLKQFLEASPTYGFTPRRIATMAKSMSDFKDLGSMNTRAIRSLLGQLVARGDVRMRISKSGNVLYQIDD